MRCFLLAALAALFLAAPAQAQVTTIDYEGECVLSSGVVPSTGSIQYIPGVDFMVMTVFEDGALIRNGILFEEYFTGTYYRHDVAVPWSALFVSVDDRMTYVDFDSYCILEPQ